jgi:peptidoglycan hydrolase-like protein with peptidoglycan-binding domain
MMKRTLLTLAVICLGPISLLRADQTIESAQQALKNQGFYYGEITGRKDADTTAAIRRYQIRNGLKITGDLDVETQRSLGTSAARSARTTTRPEASPPDEIADLRDNSSGAHTGPAVPPPGQSYRPERPSSPPDYAPGAHGLQPEVSGIFDGTPYEVAPPGLQQRVITGAQVLLARRGYYRSGIDGFYGPETEFALRAFQSQVGLPLSGRLDMQTLAALGLLPGQHLPYPARRVAPGAFPRPVFRGEWVPD